MGMLSTVNCIAHLISIFVMYISKEGRSASPMNLENIHKFASSNGNKKHLGLYFSLFLHLSVQREPLLSLPVKVSQYSASLPIRQEALRFFCTTVIRLPAPFSQSCKWDAKNLKVLSPMIKDSSLSVATLCLIQAPTEEHVESKERPRLSLLSKRKSSFLCILFPTNC